MAVIIGTTILNFTFVGVSILFMLLMMRAGTLFLAPLVDPSASGGSASTPGSGSPSA